MAVPHNDKSLSCDETLIRRINLKQHLLKIRHKDEDWQRITSAAFSVSSIPNGGMSVDILGLITVAGKNPLKCLRSEEFPYSIEFTVGEVRALDLLVANTPQKDRSFHGDIWNEKADGSFGALTTSQIRNLKKCARWFIGPTKEKKIIIRKPDMPQK